MAINSDVVVEWMLSPRIIFVPSTYTEFTVQDLVDTCRYLEQQPINMDNDRLVDAAGKEDLGGGTVVGITATLNNAQVRFAPRPTPLVSGSTATSTDARGRLLTDTTATFLSDGLYAGCTVFNVTTGEMNTLIEVRSDIQLYMFALEGGGGLGWTTGDAYSIYENEQCEITGGNLVAKDADGNSISAILQAPNVQILKTASSSATLQEQGAIQYASFNGGVTIDVTSSYTGTTYPVGTPQQPVNNIADAYIIANERGFPTFYIIGDLDITTASPSLAGFTFVGSGMDRTVIDIDAAAVVNDCTYRDAEIAGTLDGNSRLIGCLLSDLIYVKGFVEQCVLSPGTIVLAGSEEAHFLDCWSGVPSATTPIINMGGSGQALALRNYNGGIKLTNKTGTDVVSIDLNSGLIELDATVTNGTITCRGIGTLIDNSVGATVEADELLNKSNISSAVWDEDMADHFVAGSSGYNSAVAVFGGYVTIDTVRGAPGTDFPQGTGSDPIDNITDAYTVANRYSFGRFRVKSDLTIGASISVSGRTFVGLGQQTTTFTFQAGCVLDGTSFENAKVTGEHIGVSGLLDCHAVDFTVGATDSGVKNDLMLTTLFEGTTKFSSLTSGVYNAINCQGIVDAAGDFFTVDLNNTNTHISYRNFAGKIKLINNSNANLVVDFYLNAGEVLIDSTVTAGTINIYGTGELTDNSVGATVNYEGMMSLATIAHAMWDEDMNVHTNSGTTGYAFIEMAYDGKVFLDPINGTAGTQYPVGIRATPALTLAGAMTIATTYGLGTVHVIGALTISGGEDLGGLTFTSDRSTHNSITMVNAITENSFYDNLTISGAFNGRARITYCMCLDITNYNGGFRYNGMAGDIALDPTDSRLSYYANGDTFVTASSPYRTFDLQGQPFIIQQSQGDFLIKNKTDSSLTFLGSYMGHITLDSSCTAGEIMIEGGTGVTDNTGAGCTVTIDDITSADEITERVWGSAEGLTTLSYLAFIKGMTGGRWELSGTQMIFYDDDNTTELARFDITTDAASNPIERVRV